MELLPGIVEISVVNEWKLGKGVSELHERKAWRCGVPVVGMRCLFLLFYYLFITNYFLFLFFITHSTLIYKTETDSQTSKTNLWLPKGKGGGERDT